MTAFLSGCILPLSVTPVVEGTVYESGTNNPIAGATVGLTHRDNPNWIVETTTNADGTFRLPTKTVWRLQPSMVVILIGTVSIEKEGYNKKIISDVTNSKEYKYKKTVLNVIYLTKADKGRE